MRLVYEATLEQPQEQPLRPPGPYPVRVDHRARPVEGKAKPLHLQTGLILECVPACPAFLGASRRGGVLESGGEQHTVPTSPPESCACIRDRAAANDAGVEISRTLHAPREHIGVLSPVTRTRRFEHAGVAPGLLPLRGARGHTLWNRHRHV